MTYALTAAPYGALLALAWDPTAQLATLLHLDTALEDNSAGNSLPLFLPHWVPERLTIPNPDNQFFCMFSHRSP